MQESSVAAESGLAAPGGEVPAGFDEWSVKTLFRFTCQETESQYQDQHFLSVTRSAGILMFLKGVGILPFLISRVISNVPNDDVDQMFHILYPVIAIVSFSLPAVAIGLLLILQKQWARRYRTYVQGLLSFLMFCDIGRLLGSQCVPGMLAPQSTTWIAFCFIFYPAGLRLWTFRWALVFNAIGAGAAAAVLPFRIAGTDADPPLSLATYVVGCGFGVLLVYFHEGLEREQFLLHRHLDQKIIEMEACQSNERLAVKARDATSDFLARMSHEIRTPLNGISGLIDLLQQLQLPSEALRLVNNLRGASDHLMTIMNDILDLAKITSGRLSLKSADINIWQLPQLCIDMFAGQMKEKQLRWDIHVDPNVPKSVSGDKTRIVQILCNLLSNAIKFTPPDGLIKLHVNYATTSRTSSAAIDVADLYKVRLEFMVSDTGKGIGADDQAELFTPYYQVDSRITREQEGTGLGLAIVKKLVELMHGTIGLESAEGRGTVVTFRLPFDVKQESSVSSDLLVVPNHAPVDWPRLTCLVVDDTPLNVLVLQKQLQRRGSTVLTAQNGREAVSTVSANPDIDVIMMDFWMPVLDGLQATKTIREELGSRIPIIGLTADHTRSIAQRGMEAGMAAVLLKPAGWDQLEQAVGMHLRRRKLLRVDPGGVPGRSPASPSGQGPRADPDGVLPGHIPGAAADLDLVDAHE